VRRRLGRATTPRRRNGWIARAVRRHLLLTAAVTAVVIGAVVLVEIRIADEEADRLTEITATRVADISEALAAVDFGQVTGSRDEGAAATATAVDETLRPLVSLGVIARVKIWRVEPDGVRVVFSDEERVVGESRAFDPELAARLDAGEVVVLPVPDDREHRFEQGEPMREAYIGFTAADGTPMRMELYVATDPSASVARSLRVQLPVIAGSLVLLSGLMVPLTLRTVRRLDQLASERHAVLAHGLTASERVRHDLAQRLHDGVIQDLAAAGLALGSVAGRTDDPESGQVLRDVADLLRRDTDELRSLADESARLPEESLRTHLERLAIVGTTTAEMVVREPRDVVPDRVRALLWRVAGELVTNAVKHAAAGRIQVDLDHTADGFELVVSDDGVGYVPGRAEPGHLGLLLVENAVVAAGGTFRVEGSSDGTTARATLPVPHA